MVADRLKQESASGFGARSQNAASRLAGIDKQIEVIRRRQNTPSMTDDQNPSPSALALAASQEAPSATAATRANKRVMEFEQIAKNLGDLSNAKGNVVGTQAGDRMAAGVDAAYRTGGAVAPELGRDIALMANPDLARRGTAPSRWRPRLQQIRLPRAPSNSCSGRHLAQPVTMLSSAPVRRHSGASRGCSIARGLTKTMLSARLPTSLRVWPCQLA